MLLNCGIGEGTWESLGLQEDQTSNPKGNQPWIFIGRTDAEASASASTLWPHDAKSLLTWKDPDAGKYWKQEEKGMTEDDMVQWHHQLNGYEFEQAPRVGDRQEACCAVVHRVPKSWTWLSNWAELNSYVQVFFPFYYLVIFLLLNFKSSLYILDDNPFSEMSFANIHVSMLFSQNTPPSPSPTESKSLFCTSASLFVLHIGLSLPSF